MRSSKVGGEGGGKGGGLTGVEWREGEVKGLRGLGIGRGGGFARWGLTHGNAASQLRQSLEAWRIHQRLMADCEQQIQERMNALDDHGEG